ncbi:MAG: beta-galactosidase, partial [Firmicutes bacterium]|nr:beta-galactosidase [Bacillota bacterium]
MLTVKRGTFYDGDQPVFLFGGECHYFRLEPDQWAQRLQMLKAAGCNLVSTYVPWLWHEPRQYMQDFVGSTHPRRNLVRFLELCAEGGMRVMVRPGPYVMSELRNEGIPEWVFRRHPEVVAQQPSGQPHPARVISYLHPTFLDMVARWYDGVLGVMEPFWAERGGPVEILQLDNEIGMLHWVTQCGDHHPLTQRRFSDVISPQASSAGTDSGWLRFLECSEASEDGGVARHFAWALFNRQEIAEYVLRLQSLARERNSGALFAINVHGFKDFSVYSRGTDYPIGVSQLLAAARQTGALVAGDFYPGHLTYDNYHDVILATVITAAMGGPDKPIFSAEFQSGRLSDRPTVSAHDLDLLTRLCVAHGMNALNYYMFCAGDNPEDIGLFGPRHEWQAPVASDGTPRPSYAAAARLGHLFADWGSSLATTRLVRDTTLGFYAPYYMTEEPCPDQPQVRQMISEMSYMREHLH